MRSSTTKVLHRVAGLSIIERVVRAAIDANVEKIVLILGHQSEAVQAHLQERFPDVALHYALQEEQLGTAHAVLCAAPILEGFRGPVWILSGDVPTITSATFDTLQRACPTEVLTVAGMRLDDPKSYGRLLSDEGGLHAIREARDCSAEELMVCDVNAGFYRVDGALLFEGLRQLRSDNDQGEYYLTDLVSYARSQGMSVGYHLFEGEEADALEGVNDRADLAAAEERVQRGLRRAAMNAGVTLIDPSRVYLHERVQLAPDVTIEPDVSLLGETRIESGTIIEQGCRLQDTLVRANARLLAYTHIKGAEIGPHASVGPFARIREGTILEERVKVGNFVETKKAHLKRGSKANHLSYLGDIEVGEGANVGAGSITCNYNGYEKQRTEIGAGAFIGSNTQLVAPVKVGAGAFVAAGTTVTKNVSPNALALSRVPQIEKDGWAARFHENKRNQR
jgi:bifunctional UDP-N-acetylglucosamine pyrophosphorylase / glucosamine-1-phosphate N-acetyltransferase